MDKVDTNQEIQVDAIGTFDDLEDHFRTDHPFVWWVALVGPILLTLVILGAIYFLDEQGPKKAASYVGAALSAFFVFGRFIILLGSGDPSAGGPAFLKHLAGTDLFVMLTFLDTMIAMFVAFHMGILFRIPFLGPKLKSMISDGRFILRNQPWIRRAAFFGLVSFVVFPTSTTGSIGGSIFGRLLGMTRWRVVLAILTGSILGNGVMLIIGKQIQKYIPGDSWALKIGGVLLMLVALYFFERKIRSLKEAYLTEESGDS